MYLDPKNIAYNGFAYVPNLVVFKHETLLNVFY